MNTVHPLSSSSVEFGDNEPEFLIGQPLLEIAELDVDLHPPAKDSEEDPLTPAATFDVSPLLL